jgi:hypothetical protein
MTLGIICIALLLLLLRLAGADVVLSEMLVKSTP